MSRYTNTATKPAPVGRNGSVIKTSKTAKAVTGNGAPGYNYKDKSELFVLAVSNFTGQNAFYESGNSRDKRFSSLVGSIAKKDHEWVAQLLVWLRSEGNIRTAAVTGAIEYGRAVSGSVTTGEYTPRKVLASVLQRADEPAEALGYWLSTYGKKMPIWFKRALGDASVKLFNERSVLKYDSSGAKVRAGDVIQLSQVKTEGYKNDVFRWTMDRRYNNADLEKYPALQMLRNRAAIEEVPQESRKAFLENTDAKVFEDAGYSWESLSGWLGGTLTASFWETLIPSMGYMALIRNLRNFAKAEISMESAKIVASRISDPEQVAKSRQLPLRFLSAYRVMQPDNVNRGWGYGGLVDDTFKTASGRKYEALWAPELATALNLSLSSVPALSGQTLILVDSSGSMWSPISDKSTVTQYENAVAFGVALAQKNSDSVLVAYDTSDKEIRLVRGGNLLDNIASAKKQFPGGGGTNTIETVKRYVRANPGIARVIILTDEQTSGYYGNTLENVVPKNVTCITFNLAGYRTGQAPAGMGQFHTVSGLTDSAFQMIKTLEATSTGVWPWEN